MKKIKKISEKMYLVDGTYIANSFNEAVLKANENMLIPCFDLEGIELSLWEKVKHFFNTLLDCFEAVDPDNYI